MAEPEIQSAKTSFWLRLIAGWTRWTGVSANRGIFGAAVTVGAFTVLAKLVSVAKELTVAGSFGTSDALDAFLIAFLLTSFAIGAAALVLFASASWVLPLVASDFSAEKLALTRGLFYLLLPVLVLSGFSTIASAILNAGQSFALPALVPMVTPAVTIAAILGVGTIWRIYAVASKLPREC
jgi:putative peptidoglycan lipid II flippase